MSPAKNASVLIQPPLAHDEWFVQLIVSVLGENADCHKGASEASSLHSCSVLSFLNTAIGIVQVDTKDYHTLHGTVDI